ncbi:MAG: hypothetical protein GY699_01805 [Desulfobacteraceae bacterium]|nr:hypothetical protein [Desulfobacteraceae bacterium]
MYSQLGNRQAGNFDTFCTKYEKNLCEKYFHRHPEGISSWDLWDTLRIHHALGCSFHYKPIINVVKTANMTIPAIAMQSIINLLSDHFGVG